MSDLTRFHVLTYCPLKGQAGPLNIYFGGPAQILGALGDWAPVGLFPCIEVTTGVAVQVGDIWLHIVAPFPLC